MAAVHSAPGARPRWWKVDRGLVFITAGAVVLIAAGLFALPRMAQRAPSLAPATTPQGAVQRFYQALYRGDYNTAHSWLSADVAAKISVGQLQQSLSVDLRNSQINIRSMTVNDSQATIRVVITHFGEGQLFGPNEWTSENELLLRREAGAWKIVSGFGYFPDK